MTSLAIKDIVDAASPYLFVINTVQSIGLTILLDLKKTANQMTAESKIKKFALFQKIGLCLCTIEGDCPRYC